jgi:uncharacterized protein YkwD
VRHRLSILLAAVSILGCASLSVLADASASPLLASNARAGAASGRPRSGRARHARAGCRSISARLRSAASRRRRSAHGCQAKTRKPRATRRVKSSHAFSPRPRTAPLAHAPTSTPTSPAAESPAASIATVLATPCQNTELTPEAGNLELVRAAVVCLINKERAQNGVSPLQLSGQLDQAAEGHSQELIAGDYFAHVSPSGETPVDRIRGTGYISGPSVGYVIGENLAWGTYGLATPQAIVGAWIASPEHLANILEGQYRETGVGVAPQVPASLANGAPGATYAQEFGVIIR